MITGRPLEELCSPTPKIIRDVSIETQIKAENGIKKEIEKGWKAFIDFNKKPGNAVRPEIAMSWKRSRDYGIDPFKKKLGNILSQQELKIIQDEKRFLLQTALPYIKQMEELLFASGYVIVLSDEKGIFIDVSGDNELIRRYATLNHVPGAVWSEETVGTSSTSTCLVIKEPFQVSGPEHFCEVLKTTTCSSAPIFNPNGSLTGILSVASPYGELKHPHTLGMVTSIAWAIQNQLKLQQQNYVISLNNGILRATLEATDEAIITIDIDGNITQANHEASKVLKLPNSELMGKYYESIIGSSVPIAKIMNDGKPIYDCEIMLPSCKERSYLITAQPIRDDEKRPQGVVLRIKPIEKVKQMVNRFSGAEARFSFDDILGDSQTGMKALESAKKIAGSYANVLLLGESGTGKELFAQSIHNASCPHGPFVAVNCAAIPRSLIESELFGYEGGTFTGAERKGRPGKIELAHGGTLFLDEIGDMPIEVQPLLLRVLEDKKVVRLGGQRYISVDFRVIAATNKNLLSMVNDNRFREDLYFRLAVFKISIPPLRDKGDDVIILAKHFVTLIAERMKLEEPEISQAAQAALVSYTWPGNVRQLENAMVYAVTMAKNGVVEVDDLPEEIISGNSSDNIMKNGTMSIKQVEKLTIEKAIQQTGNTKDAAQILGIARSTLYRKLKDYDIPIIEKNSPIL